MKLKLVNIGGTERDLSDYIFLLNGEKEITDTKEKEKLDLSFSEDFPTKKDVFNSDYLTISKNKNKIFIRISVKNDKNLILYVVYLFEMGNLFGKGNLNEQEINNILYIVKKYTNEYRRKIVDEEKTLEKLKKELLKISDKENKKRYIAYGLIGIGIIIALAILLLLFA